MKTFLRTLVAVFSLFLITSQVWAQEEKNDSRESIIKAQKIAFFTEKIGLTIEEAKQFWPVYNEYWNKKNELIEERKNSMNYYLKHSDSMSKTELENKADQYVDYRYKKGQLLKEYHKKFKEILYFKKW